MSARSSISCISVAALLAATALFLLCTLPFKNDRVELIAQLMSYLALPSALFLTIFAWKTLTEMRTGQIALLITVALLIIGFMISGSRSQTAECYRWDVHGVVKSKYIDKKHHNWYTIEVLSDTGATVILRGISHSGWVLIRAGSRFEKNAWSPKAKIGDRTVRIINE